MKIKITDYLHLLYKVGMVWCSDLNPTTAGGDAPIIPDKSGCKHRHVPPAHSDNAVYPGRLLQAYTHCVVLHAIAEDDELSVLDGLDSRGFYDCVVDSGFVLAVGAEIF